MKHTVRTLVWSSSLVACCLVVMVLDVEAQSGSLEPPPSAVSGGLPVPTTQTQPSWDQALPANDGDPTTGCNSTRFKCVLGDAAVLDIETGLVWERSTDTEGRIWHDARLHCLTRSVGNRLGWRLPSVHELLSLVDPTATGDGPYLFIGHPFINLGTGGYWSGTTNVTNPDYAWEVGLRNTGIFRAVSGEKVVNTENVWCVRGAGLLSEY